MLDSNFYSLVNMSKIIIYLSIWYLFFSFFLCLSPLLSFFSFPLLLLLLLLPLLLLSLLPPFFLLFFPDLSQTLYLVGELIVTVFTPCSFSHV